MKLKLICRFSDVENHFLEIDRVYSATIIDNSYHIDINYQVSEGSFLKSLLWSKDITSKYFLTLSEYRDQQINEIIND